MKDNPQLPLGEVCNYLAKKWGQLPSEQREVSSYCLLVSVLNYNNLILSWIRFMGLRTDYSVKLFDSFYCTAPQPLNEIPYPVSWLCN